MEPGPVQSIAVVGSLNVDHVLSVERFPQPGETLVASNYETFAGGKGANQAYAAARLGASVHMIGQVGNDVYATWLRDGLAMMAVDVSGVSEDESVPTGMAMITVARGGQNQIVLLAGANATFSPPRLESRHAQLRRCGVLLLQLEIPLATVQTAAAFAHQAGSVVVLDPAPAASLPSDVLTCVDYLTPNESELAHLCGWKPSETLTLDEARAGAARLLQRGAHRVLVKMGARGALLCDGQHEWFQRPFEVKAVDTTAAGDAFNAAFAVALASRAREAEAMRYAAAAAALSVTKAGAQASMPHRAEVMEFLKGA
jgi:ribokinase